VIGLALGVAGIAAALRSRSRPAASTRRQATPDATPTGTSLPGDLCLVLGDSIAAGIGASDPTRRGFSVLLHGLLERVAGRPVELDNLAVPGETTTTFVGDGQLDGAVRVIQEARAAGLVAGPIVVSLGANDLLAASDDDEARESAIATAAGNLARNFDTLRRAAAGGAGGRDGDLFALSYYDPSGSNPDRPGSNAWWVARLNAEIAQAASEAGGEVVDLASVVRGHEDELTWYPTDVHPTYAGHEEI
jgi:lysophospholipase L1-like esterase